MTKAVSKHKLFRVIEDTGARVPIEIEEVRDGWVVVTMREDGAHICRATGDAYKDDFDRWGFSLLWDEDLGEFLTEGEKSD